MPDNQEMGREQVIAQLKTLSGEAGQCRTTANTAIPDGHEDIWFDATVQLLGSAIQSLESGEFTVQEVLEAFPEVMHGLRAFNAHTWTLAGLQQRLSLIADTYNGFADWIEVVDEGTRILVERLRGQVKSIDALAEGLGKMGNGTDLPGAANLAYTILLNPRRQTE